MYGDVSTDKRKEGCPHLRFMTACKRDLKACGIDTNSWDVHAEDTLEWKTFFSQGLTFGQNKL